MPIKGNGRNGSKKDFKIVTKKRTDFSKIKSILPDFSKIKSLNRNAVLAGVLASVLVVVGLFAFVFSKNSEDGGTNDPSQQKVVEIEPTETMEASLSVVEGIAEFQTADTWEPAEEELKIEPGMSLRTTGAASRAEISFADGSFIRLDANSEVNFETLTEARVVVLQLDGHTYNRVVDSSGRSYVIRTENAHFEALGTVFKASSSGDEESVEVYQSSVQETSLNKRAFEGEKLIAKNNVSPTLDATIERLDIEKVKNDEFVLWNRRLDLANEEFKDQLGFLSDIEGPKISISKPELGSTIELEAGANEGTVQIEGSTEAGAQLTVESKSISNSSPVDVAVTNDGTFKTPILKTAVGNSVFQFIAKDRSGNETILSITLLFKTKSAVQGQGIALSLDLDDNDSPTELKFSWGLVGLTTPDGVKLIYGEDQAPVYVSEEESDNVLDSIKSKMSRTVPVSDPPFESGRTYNFRVCRYDSDKDTCDIYSNQVTVDIP